jgi:CRP/FNR family transcriptional regulator, cyclic AMP receptor protein
MASPAAIALTPILLVVALLWWETTSPIGVTLKEQPDDGADAERPGIAPAVQRSARNPVHRALIGCGIFSRTSPELVTVLSEKLTPERFGAGRLMGGESDFEGCVYVIISGKVKVSYQRPDGTEVALKLLGPSEMFGAITLFDPGPQDMVMTTLTEVVAVPITRDQLLSWMATCPEVCDQVLRLFARWVKAMTNSLVDLAFADEQGRIASRLLLLKQRFGQQDGDVVRVVHGLSSAEFSHLAGVDPETVGVTLRAFEANGWIRLEENSIVIVDGYALSQVRQVSMGE